MTPEEVADWLKVKVTWVYAAAQRGALPTVKVGRYVRFRPSELQRWMEQGGVDSEQSSE